MKILIGKNHKEIWLKNKEKFLQYFIEESGEKRIEKNNLEYRFHDSNGKIYYGFPESLPLPLERWGKMKDFLMYMNIGISLDEYTALIDVAEKNWLSFIKTGKNASKVGYIFQELRNRSRMIFHTELLYNFLAVQLIREDEDVAIFNNEIHNEKVNQFKKECANGQHYFFFQKPELKKLHEFSNFTKEQWLEYWKESEVQQMILKESLKNILSPQD